MLNLICITHSLNENFLLYNMYWIHNISLFQFQNEISLGQNILTGGFRTVYCECGWGREGGMNAVSLLFSCRRAALILARV